MAKSKSELADSLASELADSLNKKFKNTGYQTAFFLDGDTKAPSEVRGWVKSGSSMLDLAISNREEGGFPVGRITEITGLEASGKSLLAAHALANTQKQGGLAVYIDTENAVSREFLEAIGLDLEKMLYVPLETIEDIFEAIESIVENIRKSNKDRLVTIVVDSVMGASTKIEMAKEFDKDGYATSKAIILSKGMRKLTNMIGREKICLIFTNQLRTRLGVAFGDPYTTSGGKAIPFHASVRLRLKSVGQIKVKKDGVDQAIGIKTRCQVVKNRMGPPLKTVDYDIYFESGIDDFGGWLNIMKQFKLVSTAGAWYTFTRADGSEVKFLSKDFEKKLDEVDGLKDEIYAQICESYILRYKPGEDIGIDDVEITEEFVNEEG
jgi:recombination protein RecA